MGDQHPVPCDAGEAALIWVRSMIKWFNISPVLQLIYRLITIVGGSKDASGIQKTIIVNEKSK